MLDLGKKKILITGSNGLLGNALRKSLSRVNSMIIATGRGSDTIKSYGDIYVQMDINSAQNCRKVLDDYRPNVIINTAAFTQVDECEKNQDKCLNINANSLSNLISYCQNQNAHLIHMSTDFVFDGKKGWYSEEDKCSPVNYYGYSKYKSESLIMDQKINFTIIRTSLVYDMNGDVYNFFHWIRDSLIKKSKLYIVNDQYRTPTFVYDIVGAISKIINNQKYGIYHISSGERLSIYQIVCYIANYYGYGLGLINRVSSKELNQIARRPLDSSLLIDKAITELNFKPTTLLKLLT